MPPEAAEKKYWAFISYSSKDKKWGAWLHNRLENYPIPKEFQGTKIFDGSVLGKNLRPVFRDRDELSGASDLGDAILEALNESRFLIVLCSPHSARSQWVEQEIKDFIAISGEQNLLALILNGEPNASSPENDFDETLECFPPSLRYPAEPLAGDLRKGGDGKERGFLKILAGVSQLDFDILYRRHERAQRRRLVAWGAAAAVIIAALAGLSIFSIRKSREQKLLLDNVALADHDSALQASEQGRYRESAAYYARSLSIRPNNTTVARSAISSAIMADTLFAKQRHILKIEDPVTSLFLHPAEEILHVKTSGDPFAFSLVTGEISGASPDSDWIEFQRPDMKKMVDDFPWLEEMAPGLSVAVLSPEGTKLFAGTVSGKIHKFDLATRRDEWAARAKQRKNRISGIAVSPCGETLAVADWDSSLSIIDSGNGALRDTLQLAYNVDRLFFSVSGYFLVTTSQDGYARVFDTGTSPLLLKTVIESPWEPPAHQVIPEDAMVKIASFPQPAEQIKLSPDGKFLVGGNRKGSLIMLSLLSEKSNSTLRNGRITDVEISPDSLTCYVSSRDRNLIAYDLETGNEKWKQAFKGYVNEISLSKDGCLIAAASDDFTFRIIDTTSGKTVWSTLTDNCVKHIAFEGKRLRAATDEHLFDLDCSHLLQKVTDERGELATYLVTHAAMRVHDLTPVRSKKHRSKSDYISKVLDWRKEHPAGRTRSPSSNEIVSRYVGRGLGEDSRNNAEQLHRLAPWHPLTPASIAEHEGTGDSVRQRYLCELTVERLRKADGSLPQITQDRETAAKWMRKLGFEDLADEAIGKK